MPQKSLGMFITALQLNDNFFLPCHNYRNILFEFRKNIENNIKKLPAFLHLNIRNRVIPIINKLQSVSPQHDSSLVASISKLIAWTKFFLCNNPKLIFIRADKANITVAMNRDNYVNKMVSLLSDNNTYTRVHKDSIRRITNNRFVCNKQNFIG